MHTSAKNFDQSFNEYFDDDQDHNFQIEYNQNIAKAQHDQLLNILREVMELLLNEIYTLKKEIRKMIIRILLIV